MCGIYHFFVFQSCFPNTRLFENIRAIRLRLCILVQPSFKYWQICLVFFCVSQNNVCTVKPGNIRMPFCNALLSVHHDKNDVIKQLFLLFIQNICNEQIYTTHYSPFKGYLQVIVHVTCNIADLTVM